MFRVPSSTPPSSPGWSRESRAHPSTTPAGPPPDRSYIQSSTPAGAPPNKSLFGNSNATTFNPRKIDFHTSHFGSSPPKNELFGVGSGQFGVPTSARPGSRRSRSGNSFQVPSSPPHGSNEDEDEDSYDDEDDEDEDMDEETDEDAEGEDDDMDDEEEEAARPSHNDPFSKSRQHTSNKLSHSTSRNSATDEVLGPPMVRPDAKQSLYDLSTMARGLTPQFERIVLRESDDLILETERVLEKLYESFVSDSPETRGVVVGDIAQELNSLWKKSSQAPASTPFSSSTRSNSPPLASAAQLADLLLILHHPVQLSQERSAFSLVPSRPDRRNFQPIPKVLLDWVNAYHRPLTEVTLVMKQTRGYSAHEHFWDAVQASALRGRFDDTMKLLRGANLAVAETASVDGLGNTGYTGDHLDCAERVTRAAANLLEQCPAVVSEDWDVKGHDWSIFRQRVLQAIKDLQEFSEGGNQNRYDLSHSLQASHFGLSQSVNNFNLSVASRKAESRVPWSVYESLIRLYKQLLGDEEEIMTISADWIEAVLGLAIWWNGDEDIPQEGFAASRRSVARSQRIRPVDVTPTKAYGQRLSAALATILESNEEELGVNTSDRMEIGLACIFDDNVEGALHILRGWSLPVASAVAEIASAGDWFRRADGILDQFDQSDLMVLSYNEDRRTGLSKDDLLLAYANQLASKGALRSQNGKIQREGWELAIQVMGRMDNGTNASIHIEEVLNGLGLDSTERVDKVIHLCNTMGLAQQAQGIALKYADDLRANTQNYGDTLLYYARAHNATKIQEVLRVLVAHCLVKSVAFPPLTDLDSSLKKLITAPKQTLTQLASADPEGAQLLSNHLSGYATIRKFYDLRDADLYSEPGQKPTHRPLARKRLAASALTVIIASAASSIRGGLYDPATETVVQVDVLLPLLGEALPFLNQPTRTLTTDHLYALLAAVEDFETAPSMIRTQCSEVLSSTLAAAHGSPNIPDPASLLQKSVSGGLGNSTFSLVGSTELGSVEGRSTESSTVLVGGRKEKGDGVRRAWDWRAGFRKEAGVEEVVRVLRLGIAREMARAFLEG